MAAPVPDEDARRIFGSRLPLASAYADRLVTDGVERGILGPREADRIWSRHLVNCAVVADLIPHAARVADIGSGAGLPGLPLAIRRPDLALTLVEPMLRRTEFLAAVVAELGLADQVGVLRGRTDDRPVRSAIGGSRWLVARAVAPLDRLVKWCLPLLAPGGTLLAIKGRSAQQEAARLGESRMDVGGVTARQVGSGSSATWVVLVRRTDRQSDKRDEGAMTDYPDASPESVPVVSVAQEDQPEPVSRETAAPELDTAAPPVSRETATSPTVDEPPIAREAAQALHVLNVRQQQWPRPTAPRVLTVANQKGGVGKTTSAVNIAAALAMHGLRVLLIDLDPQGNASTALSIPHAVGTPSSYDVLLGGADLADVAVPCDFAATLRCVPATLDLAGADIELTSHVAREHRLQRALDRFLKDFGSGEPVDYVFIDCPPSLGLLTLNALVAGREVLIPIQCEYYALEGLAQLLNTVELVKSHLNPALAVTTVLLTMYDSRTRLADQVADDVRAHFRELVLEPTIPRNVRVSEAPGFGQTVITYDPGSRGAASYLQAAREIADRGARTDAEPMHARQPDETLANAEQ